MRYSIKMVAYLLMLLGMMSFIACGGSGGGADGGGPNPPVSANIDLTATTSDNGGVPTKIIREVTTLAVQGALPSQLNMYETYAGVQLDVDLDIYKLLGDLLNPATLPATLTEFLKTGALPTGLMDTVMGSIKQTPLLVQFWALDDMQSSTNNGGDDWMTDNDTIDMMYGYFHTEKTGGPAGVPGTYTQTTYSGFGINKSGEIQYEVEGYAVDMYRKFKTTHKDKDNGFVRTTEFEYGGPEGKMSKATNYSDADEKIFESVYVFSYDSEGRLTGMKSYEDAAMTTRLGGGSYTTLTWGVTPGGNKTLDLTLGLQLNIPWVFGLLHIKPHGLLEQALVGVLTLFKIPTEGELGFLSFSYEFNKDNPKTIKKEKETISKLIEYAALDTTKTKITNCSLYVYDEASQEFIASGGTTASYSDNYSDNCLTEKVSTTVNKLVITFAE